MKHWVLAVVLAASVACTAGPTHSPVVNFLWWHSLWSLTQPRTVVRRVYIVPRRTVVVPRAVPRVYVAPRPAPRSYSAPHYSSPSFRRR